MSEQKNQPASSSTTEPARSPINNERTISAATMQRHFAQLDRQDEDGEDQEEDDHDLGGEDEDEYYESRYGMYSESGDEEYEEILGGSRTWDQLVASMESAVHQEINDTAVYEKIYEHFEQQLQDEAEDGKYETYEMYCERVSGQTGRTALDQESEM